jgi:hypothetical protein
MTSESEAMAEDLVAEVSRALAHINPVWAGEAHWDDQWYAEEARAVLGRLEAGADADVVRSAIVEVFAETWPTFWQTGQTDPDFVSRLDKASEYIARRLHEPPVE